MLAYLLLASIASTSPELQLNNLKREYSNHQIYVEVFQANTPEGWDGTPIVQQQFSGQKDSHTLTTLEAGRYAIRLFVDTNSNGQLDRSNNGIPKEPFGSSGSKKMKRPPTFLESLVELSDRDSVIEIDLRAPRVKKTQSSKRK